MSCIHLINTDVGPIIHSFTLGDATDTVIATLKIFEAAVRGLNASGGGDFPEYAFSAMLEALKYSFFDEYGLLFTPMNYYSEMIVITDATSKLPELKSDVIQTALEQKVSINFILSNCDIYYSSESLSSFYEDVANETGGIIYEDEHTSWSILNFYDRLSAAGSVPGRKRRSSSNEVPVSVSRFVYRLLVSFLVGSHNGTSTVQITLPNGEVESADIEDNVMIYLKSNPLPGHYLFSAGVKVQDDLIKQDTTLDVSLLYLDNEFTVASPSPPPACKL